MGKILFLDFHHTFRGTFCYYGAMDDTPKKEKNDLELLAHFIRTYCRGKHGSAKGTLCAECSELLEYAHARRRKCPLDPKPACKHCTVHCYAKNQRARIKEVMAYSGRRLLLRGRLDLLWHYFF